jgi:kynurenine formamidase
MRIIDLSHTITDANPVFPGDPEVSFRSHHTHDSIGYCVTSVTMGTHTGTHIDVPLHRLAGGAAVDGIPLEKTMGLACVADLTWLGPGEEITPEHLSPFEAALAEANIMLIRTGWSSHFGRDDFFSGFNGLSQEAAEWLVSHKLDMVALESPSVHPEKHLEIHSIFLSNGVLVAESLNNLGAITKPVVRFFAVPLKLEGLDGSPVRAFAIEE